MKFFIKKNISNWVSGKPSTISSFRRNGAGFTLAEVVVAVGIFAIASVLISSVYLGANKLHQNTASLQRLQNEGRYMMEKMAREIRAREVFYPALPVNQPQDYLDFRSDEIGELVSFQRSADQTDLEYIVNGLSADLNAEDVDVVDVKFYVISNTEDQWGADPTTNIQPRVTIFLKIKNNELINPKFQREIILQTTISSKIYKR
jgi:prepilin-type N-terminal cleavage/methylation domain-containing protein